MPSKRYVVLPNGRRCSLGVYVASWKTILQIVRETPAASIRGFDHFPDEAPRVLRALRLGMHDRINRHLPGFGVGRKWDQDWQRAARHCANEVNYPRLVVRWVPADLRARLEHRLSDD